MTGKYQQFTFYVWLTRQTYRDDSVGTLARLFRDDDNLPAKKTKTTLLAHLKYREAEDWIFPVFHSAWREYKEIRKEIL